MLRSLRKTLGEGGPSSLGVRLVASAVLLLATGAMLLWVAPSDGGGGGEDAAVMVAAVDLKPGDVLNGENTIPFPVPADLVGFLVPEGSYEGAVLNVDVPTGSFVLPWMLTVGDGQ